MFKKRRGQLISLELVVSIIGFMVIFMFVISLWNLYAIRLQDNVVLEEQQLLAFQIADILATSRGVPDNWERDPTTAIVMGLQRDPGVLDKAKTTAFVSSSYDDLRELFNIERYDFLFRVSALTGTLIEQQGVLKSPVAYLSVSKNDVIGIQMLNNSAAIWDFYWCSATQMPDTTARYSYQINEYKECFGDMIENRSAYNSMLTENPNIHESDFNNPELGPQHKTWLQQFVQSGNRYVQDGKGKLICDLFNMSGCGGALGQTGIVESLEFLNNVTLGQEIDFDKPRYSLRQDPGDYNMNTIISNKAAPDETLFGYWDYGNGRVFYVTDLEITNDDLEIESIEIKFEIGKEPTGNATNVIAVQRALAYENYSVLMELVLWK